MPRDFRNFEVRDASGRVWTVRFLWVQNAISIRHADTVDVKFELSSGGERTTKAVALLHPHLLQIAARLGRPVSDPWCSELAALHLRYMIESGEDMDKALVTPTLEEIDRYVPAA